jgi:hypothetical protein
VFTKFMITVSVLMLGISAQAKPTQKFQKPSEGSLYDTDQTELPDSKSPAPIGSEGLPTINEDWYTLWGLGLAKSAYSGDLGDAYEHQASLSGSHRSLQMSADLFGFYWPLEGHQTMIGVILSDNSDTIKFSDGHISRLTTSLLAFSTHHFFGKNIGDGWFVRGDIGVASANIHIKDGTNTYDKGSDTPIGVQFGGGYGFAIGAETRLLVGLYVRQLPSIKISGVTVSGGAPVEEIKGSVTSVVAGFLF